MSSNLDACRMIANDFIFIIMCVIMNSYDVFMYRFRTLLLQAQVSYNLSHICTNDFDKCEIVCARCTHQIWMLITPYSCQNIAEKIHRRTYQRRTTIEFIGKRRLHYTFDIIGILANFNGNDAETNSIVKHKQPQEGPTLFFDIATNINFVDNMFFVRYRK